MRQDSGLKGAIERLAGFFGSQGTRQALLARRLLGRPDGGDADLTRHLMREAAGETRQDGSIGGAFLPTAWRVIEILELGGDAEDAVIVRLTGWLLHRQDQPGTYSEGCSKPRHARRVCEHFLGGFFSPAPISQRVSPVTLPNGKVFRAEAAARFALSCLGLRAVLLAGQDQRPGVRGHLEGLAGLRDEWLAWGGYFAPDLTICAVHALALAPPPNRGVLGELTAAVAGHQESDGTWPQADLFAVLDALLAAGTPEAIQAVHRAVPALLTGQRADGTFGPVAQQERGLVGLRALLAAAS